MSRQDHPTGWGSWFPLHAVCPGDALTHPHTASVRQITVSSQGSGKAPRGSGLTEETPLGQPAGDGQPAQA